MYGDNHLKLGLFSQDINFFDSESIGDLTSRLGSDCQQVSRVIGNDLNLILRNLLQVPQKEKVYCDLLTLNYIT